MKDLLKTKSMKAAIIVAVVFITGTIGSLATGKMGIKESLIALVVLVLVDWLIIRKDLKYLGMDKAQIWAQWDDVHLSNDQLRRIQRAVEENYVIKSVNEVCCSAKFVGGKGTYKTSLTECSCPDFKQRKIPCKHMYKLAIDLNVFDPEGCLDYSEGKGIHSGYYKEN